MRRQHSIKTWSSWTGLTLAVLLAAGCSGTSRTGTLRLSGSQEVPSVPTNASANTNIVVQLTKCPSSATSNSCPEILGSVYTTWAVPPFTFLSDEQYAAYQGGQFYVNVRSTAHPKGEIRAQLTP